MKRKLSIKPPHKIRLIVFQYPPPFICIVLILCASAVQAEHDFWQRGTLTGDWKSNRTRMADNGIVFETIYTGDIFSNVSGGKERGTEYLNNTDLCLRIDLDTLAGWEGGSFFLYGLGNQGGSPTDDVGDTQGVSNIDAPDAWKVYEAWLQQTLFEDTFSALVGLYDLNSEFDVIEAAGVFLNSSHGIGPDFSQSGQNGPSIFPATSVGLRIKIQPTDAFYLQSVVLDGVPGNPNNPHGTFIQFSTDDGVLMALELAYFTGMSEKSNAPYGKVALGAWHYTGDFDDVRDVDSTGNPVKKTSNFGIYSLAERNVYHEQNDPTQGLELFCRFGVANNKVNQFDYYLGAGLVYTGLFPDRDEDQLGGAFAKAHNGSRFQQAQQNAGLSVDDFELALELTYRFQISPWLSLQPDIQYIFNPGTDPALDDALTIGTRFEISF